MGWVDRVLAFFEKYLPAFLIGMKVGQDGKNELQKENTNLKLELKAAEDEKRIEAHNRNLTNDELVSEIVRTVGTKKE